MSRIREAGTVSLLGVLAFTLAHAAYRPLALVGSFAAIVLVPAVTVARAVGDDRMEQIAFAYGGLALSCWSLWFAAVAVQPGRTSSLLAPLLLSVVLAAARAPRSAVPPLQRRWTLPTSLVAVTAAGFLALVLIPFAPYGWTAADGVHRMGMTDWQKHLVVTTALLTDARFPPANPFLATAAAAPYYYGFHLIAAGVLRGAGGGEPYAVLLWLTALTALAFPFALFVLARRLFTETRAAVLSAAGGVLLAGFDAPIWLFNAAREVFHRWPLGHGFVALRAAVPSTHLNFWLHHNERQLNAPYLATIWAPHHVAAVLLALLTVCLLLPRTDRPRPGLSQRLVAAAMLGSLAAVSAYVALALFVAVAAIILVDSAVHGTLPWRTSAYRRWSAVGFPAVVVSLPVLWALRGSGDGGLTLALSAAGSWSNGAFFSSLFGDRTLTRLLDTPALSVVQFGLIGVCGVRTVVGRWRRGTLTAAQREAFVLALAIGLFVTVVRPPVGGPNNLFARPMLLVWGLLACLASGDWLEHGRTWSYRAMLGVCLAGTLLALAGATGEGALFWAAPPEAVSAARWINANTPVDALVAAPRSRFNLGYWLWRRTVASDGRLAALFGATAGAYDETAEQLAQAYASATPEDAWQRFGALGATVVITDSAGTAWVSPRCFTRGYEGSQLAVLVRRSRCEASAP